MSPRVEARPCRIHPAVTHRQLAVCTWDATPLDGGRCPACGAEAAPCWRCVEAELRQLEAGA